MTAGHPSTLLLTRRQIAGLLSFADYCEAVAAAFRAHGEGRPQALGLLHLEAPEGEFHLKAGSGHGQRPYFAFKINGGFYQNRARYGLPNILGSILLCDARNGFPLAVLESGEITRQRTAAAAAVAAQALARPESRVLALCGCGTQGEAQLAGLAQVLPLRKALLYDRDPAQRQRLQRLLCGRLPCELVEAPTAAAAAREADIVVTCTPARQPLLGPGDLRPGTFVAAMGADSPEKQELDPALLASATVVADLIEQCARVGELHHALAGGLLKRNQVHGELGAVLAGRCPGRCSAEEIIIFDSTGTALQDAAAAAIVYERACERGLGTAIDMLA